MADSDALVRTLLIILAIIILAPLLMMLFAFPMMGLWSGGHMWNGTGTTGSSWLWLLLWALFLAVLLGVGSLFVRAAFGPSRNADTALEELRVAYARGDLSSEEFEERRERLRREE